MTDAQLSSKQVEDAETHLLLALVALLDKASYRPLTRKEYDLATKEQYMLTVPVAIDTSKVGKRGERTSRSSSVAVKTWTGYHSPAVVILQC